MKRFFKFAVIFCLLVAGTFRPSFAQEEGPPNDPVLQEAIQAVQNFLGDTSIIPVYRFEKDNSNMLLRGPGHFFVFEVPGYDFITIRIDERPMRVVYWSKDEEIWIPSVDRSRLPLSVEQMVQIAKQYAQQHWPYWNEFPLKMIQYTTDRRARWNEVTLEYDKDEVYCLAVRFTPYFVNSSGIKIPYLAAHCFVVVEPYEGSIVDFGWSYNGPITLSQEQLDPTIPPSQAEVIGEQAFFNYYKEKAYKEGGVDIDGLLTVDIQMDPFRNITIYGDSWWPERLAIGVTFERVVKLVYIFDKVLLKNASTGEVLMKFFVAMDAHTGEIVWVEAPMSLEALPQIHGQFPNNLVSGVFLLILIIVLFIAVSLVTFLKWKNCKKSSF
jgi:hypothetical protein